MFASRPGKHASLGGPKVRARERGMGEDIREGEAVLQEFVLVCTSDELIGCLVLTKGAGWFCPAFKPSNSVDRLEL